MPNQENFSGLLHDLGICVKWHEIVTINDQLPFTSELERQRRRRQLEQALQRLMPWNDARFSTINVPAPRPFEYHNADDWSRMLDMNLGATIRITIGVATFWCIPALLRLHCGYFARDLRESYRFREGSDLCAVGFRAAYDWMRLQDPLDDQSSPGRMVELLHAAIQLEMTTLEAMVNRYLCTSRFRERAAVDIYFRSMPFQALYPQRQLMLQRIGFFFLALVGTPQFLEMPTDDVIMLLQQNNLGVNSEIEVLYSCFRWISARPTQRAVLMRRLMECVRFTRLPLTMLRQLWRGFGIDGCSQHNIHCMVTSFHHDIIVQGRISDAIKLVSLRRVFPDRNEFKQYCRAKGLKVEAPREWMYDEDCPYHQPRPSAPYSHVVTASEFLIYIQQRAQAPRVPPRTIPNLRAILPAPDGEVHHHSSSSPSSPLGDDNSNIGDHIENVPGARR